MGGGAAVDRSLTSRRLELPSSSSRSHLSLVSLHPARRACSCTPLITPAAAHLISALSPQRTSRRPPAALQLQPSLCLSATAQQPRTTAAQPALHPPTAATAAMPIPLHASPSSPPREPRWRSETDSEMKKLASFANCPSSPAAPALARQQAHAESPDPEECAFAGDC